MFTQLKCGIWLLATVVICGRLHLSGEERYSAGLSIASCCLCNFVHFYCLSLLMFYCLFLLLFYSLIFIFLYSCEALYDLALSMKGALLNKLYLHTFISQG